jgi:hypothetical protein
VETDPPVFSIFPIFDLLNLSALIAVPLTENKKVTYKLASSNTDYEDKFTVEFKSGVTVDVEG